MKLISNIKQRYKAPALARGLEILSLLANSEPLSLEKLSYTTKIPKASLLRLLETLEIKGFVERNPVNRFYTNKVIFLPVWKEFNLTESINLFLKDLSFKTGRTAEFYIIEKDHLKITARHECESRIITVKANLGFIRELDGEFEAAARIVHAFTELPPCRFNKKLWQYKNGKKEKITLCEYKKFIAFSKKNFTAIDFEFNSNGVRRSAAPLFQNEKFLGVAAIAENYFPGCDKESIKNLSILKKESMLFSKKIIN